LWLWSPLALVSCLSVGVGVPRTAHTLPFCLCVWSSCSVAWVGRATALKRLYLYVRLNPGIWSAMHSELSMLGAPLVTLPSELSISTDPHARLRKAASDARLLHVLTKKMIQANTASATNFHHQGTQEAAQANVLTTARHQRAEARRQNQRLKDAEKRLAIQRDRRDCISMERFRQAIQAESVSRDLDERMQRAAQRRNISKQTPRSASLELPRQRPAGSSTQASAGAAVAWDPSLGLASRAENWAPMLRGADTFDSIRAQDAVGRDAPASHPWREKKDSLAQERRAEEARKREERRLACFAEHREAAREKLARSRGHEHQRLGLLRQRHAEEDDRHAASKAEKERRVAANRSEALASSLQRHHVVMSSHPEWKDRLRGKLYSVHITDHPSSRNGRVVLPVLGSPE